MIALTTTQGSLVLYPVDLNGRCVMADEIGGRHHDSMHPLKWECANECRLLTSGKIEVVLGTKVLFQKCSSWAGQS